MKCFRNKLIKTFGLVAIGIFLWFPLVVEAKSQEGRLIVYANGPYEVWGGYQRAPGGPQDDEHYEYYYNIDLQEGYAKLERNAETGGFPGGYKYYVVATHSLFSLDAICLPNGKYIQKESFAEGEYVTWGNVHRPWQFDEQGNLIGSPIDYAHDDYIYGPPDGLTDDVGHPDDTVLRYEGFVAVENPPQVSFEKFDGVDFSAGEKIISDPKKIISIIDSGGATIVEGAVTDGVTRLLLGLKTNALNEVTFSLDGTGSPGENGILRSIDGKQEGESITVYTHNVNGQEYAGVIYQSPENFVREGNEDDKNISERAITLNVKSNRTPSFELSEEIRLIRPPVILVHGLWSSWKAWYNPDEETDFKRMLEAEIKDLRVGLVNYEDDNSEEFEVNKNVVRDRIEKIKDSVRKVKRVAITQVDVVGHSMGGLLARIWAGQPEYLNKENFAKGDINKLITIDSPHHGSFFAYAGLTCWRNPHSKKIDTIKAYMDKDKKYIDKGAIEDLMIGSDAIEAMNDKEILPLAYSLVGSYSSFSVSKREKTWPKREGILIPYFKDLPEDYGGSNFWVGDSYVPHNELINNGYDISSYVIGGGSDLVVSLDSQKGGLDKACYIFWHHHMDAATTEVANFVVDLLNLDRDNIFGQL